VKNFGHLALDVTLPGADSIGGIEISAAPARAVHVAPAMNQQQPGLASSLPIE